MAQMEESRKKIESDFMADFWAFRKAVGTPPEIIYANGTAPDEQTLQEDHMYWDYVMRCVEALAVKYKSKDPEGKGYYDSMVLACVNDLELRSRKKTDDGSFGISTLNILRKIRGLPPVGVIG